MCSGLPSCQYQFISRSRNAERRPRFASHWSHGARKRQMKGTFRCGSRMSARPRIKDVDSL